MPTAVADDIKQAVRFLATRSPSLLGSQIGASIKRAFPKIDIKVEFGGLATFLREHCGEFITFVGKTGGDNLYRSEVFEANPNEDDEDVRRAFVGPDAGRPIYVDSSFKWLSIEPVLEGIEIQPLNHKEHRSIAEAFLSRAPDHVHGALSAALQQDEYWPIWRSIVDTADNATRGAWRSFRSSQIDRLFRARLEEKGVSEPDASHLVLLLSKQDRPKRAVQQVHRAKPVNYTRPPRAGMGLRELLICAVGNMSEAELRQIWVPAGALCDALGGR